MSANFVAMTATAVVEEEGVQPTGVEDAKERDAFPATPSSNRQKIRTRIAIPGGTPPSSTRSATAADGGGRLVGKQQSTVTDTASTATNSSNNDNKLGSSIGKAEEVGCRPLLPGSTGIRTAQFRRPTLVRSAVGFGIGKIAVRHPSPRRA